MRLPVSNIITPGNPAFSFQNALSALRQQKAAAQIAQAQAQYAPQQQQGIANQEQGYGQNALAGGMFAVPTAQANMLNAQLQPEVTQAGINLTQAETGNVGQNTLQIGPNAAANRALAVAQAWRQQNPNSTIAQFMAVFHQALNDSFNAITSNTNASVPPASTQSSPTPPNPFNYVPNQSVSNGAGSSPSQGAITYNGKTYNYTATRTTPNGQTQVWIPALNGWGF